MVLIILGILGIIAAGFIALKPGVVEWLDWQLNERGRSLFGEEPDVQRSKRRAGLIRVGAIAAFAAFSLGCFVQGLSIPGLS